MTHVIPPQLNEAVDGFLLVMLIFSGVYFLSYLLREWVESRMSWIVLHRDENKLAFALLTLSSGLSVKEGSEWWWFHLKNNGLSISWPILVPAIIVGALVAGWGLMCLLRALTRYEWSRWVWVWLTVIAVLFGVGSAII